LQYEKQKQKTYRRNQEDRLDGVEGFGVEGVEKDSTKELHQTTLYKKSQQIGGWFFQKKAHESNDDRDHWASLIHSSK